MTLQPRNTLPASLPASLLRKRADSPRLFTLVYDNSRVKSANPQYRQQAREKQHRFGVLWPEGGVSLSSQGNYFTSMDSLRDYLDERGVYTLTWVDSGEEESNAHD